MSEPRRKRKWWIALVVVVLFIIGGHHFDKRRFETGDRGFSHVTGMQLPANVSATAHAAEIGDAFVHTTHYWLLQGPAASLLMLAPRPQFERTDPDDAAGVLDAARHLGLIGDAKMTVGFEGSYDGGRDRWLLLIGNDRAIYAW